MVFSENLIAGKESYKGVEKGVPLGTNTLGEPKNVPDPFNSPRKKCPLWGKLTTNYTLLWILLENLSFVMPQNNCNYE